MQLFYNKTGTGNKVLIILHGLYGSGDNWLSIARQIKNHYTVYLPDLRNHGKSPHSTQHNYTVMLNDIFELIQQINASKLSIIGHSMGGKLAMFFTAKYPNLVEKLVVVDMSPRPYAQLKENNPHILFHLNLMNTLLNTNLEECSYLSEVEKLLAQKIDNTRLIKFLLKNTHKVDGKYSWKINLPALNKNLPEIMEGLNVDDFIDTKINTPTLFIKGEQSDYISKNDFSTIDFIFTTYKIIEIPNAGHWLHAEQPKLVLSNLNSFL
jgi:pimeloyl-ACP methyl ester carboxylesterase